MASALEKSANSVPSPLLLPSLPKTRPTRVEWGMGKKSEMGNRRKADLSQPLQEPRFPIFGDSDNRSPSPSLSPLRGEKKKGGGKEPSQPIHPTMCPRDTICCTNCASVHTCMRLHAMCVCACVCVRVCQGPAHLPRSATCKTSHPFFLFCLRWDVPCPALTVFSPTLVCPPRKKKVLSASMLLNCLSDSPTPVP